MASSAKLKLGNSKPVNLRPVDRWYDRTLFILGNRPITRRDQACMSDTFRVSGVLPLPRYVNG
jgi:hypothetical protein